MSPELGSLTIVLGTVSTAWVRGPRIIGMLDNLGLPRQYDRNVGCWMTSRRGIGDLIAYAEAAGMRVHVLDRTAQPSLPFDEAMS